MDRRAEIREFLTSRRARVTPARAGLPTYGPRRVPGLRREEVAVLAGISAPYYARLERGDVINASDSVIEALARALRLDDAERAHLFDLARAGNPAVQRGHGDQSRRVRPVVQQLLAAFTGAAGLVGNDRLEILGANRIGYGLFAAMFASGSRPANLARFTFLDPAAREFFADWERAASDIVAALRSSAARNPHDRELTGLIGELATRAEAFRVRWATHDVQLHPSGVKRLRHPLVGEIELDYEQLELPSDHRLAIMTFTAPAGTHAAEALAFLGSWNLGREEADPSTTSPTR
ncbi:helix-turn-helix transcriptional regulator [Streptomyces sp. NPDC005538]|uniref:helix-turn-helix transcriptional regulator n=1 Tax=unclassified Streptomyces TaxID=2593676 RepID=UPI0033A5E1C6